MKRLEEMGQKGNFWVKIAKMLTKNGQSEIFRQKSENAIF